MGDANNTIRLTEEEAAPGKKDVSQAGHYASALSKLEKSQWFNPSEMADYQFQLIRPLLVHACQNVPYYRKRFQAAGLNPRAISAENWHKVPILTRKALQKNVILSQIIPEQHGEVYVNETSGSTGQPVRIFSTEITQFFFKLLNIRDCLWHGRNMCGKHASIKFLPKIASQMEGASLPSWGFPVDVLYGTGPLVMLDIRHPIKHQLEWLTKHNPDYLLTYPSNLKALIEESLRSGIKLPNLKEVRTISETLTPNLRSLCLDAWGVPLTDAYSSQEFGYIAIQCPEHEHYHVQAESVLLEILNDQGQPCQPGEIGRVVLTSLLNYATPLIRYEIRDYVEAGPICPCGRGLPVIKRIVGRQRNMLTLPSGAKRWPMVAWSRYQEVAPIRQFQFIQHTVSQIEMRLVADRELSPEEQSALKSIVQEGLGYPFEIRLTALQEIPQGHNGKYEEFLSLLDGAAVSDAESL
jgi:phenylacetate-CoA ligase